MLNKINKMQVRARYVCVFVGSFGGKQERGPALKLDIATVLMV